MLICTYADSEQCRPSDSERKVGHFISTPCSVQLSSQHGHKVVAWRTIFVSYLDMWTAVNLLFYNLCVVPGCVPFPEMDYIIFVK